MRTTGLLCDFLEDHGFPIPATEEARGQLASIIFTAEPTRRLLLVERPGWHGGQFLLGSETLGVGAERLVIDGVPGCQLARVQQVGALADWQTNVAKPCEASSYLVFALCLAFAAPLLRLAQVESGCMHFSGGASQDIGIVEAAAATIFGRPGDAGYVRPWKEAITAGAQMAEGHCDLPLILSGLDRSDFHPKIAAQKAANIAYSMTSSSARHHLARPEGRIAEAGRRVHLLVVSAGDLGLVGNVPISRGVNEEARIIDIPVSSRRTSIFDRLMSGQSRERDDLVARLQKSCVTYYGAAGRAFVQQLVSAVANDEVKFQARLNRRMSHFFARAGVDTGDAYEIEFAKRFALAYAAGTLAIDCNVLPWHRDLVKRSIRRCYWRALDGRTGPQELIRAAADAVIRRLQRTDDIADLRGTSRPIDLNFAKRARALLLPHDDGSSLLAIRPEVFRSLVGPNVSAQHVAAELERRGHLIPRPNGRRTRQIRVPGAERRRDYYCLRGDLVADDW